MEYAWRLRLSEVDYYAKINFGRGANYALELGSSIVQLMTMDQAKFVLGKDFSMFEPVEL